MNCDLTEFPPSWRAGCGTKTKSPPLVLRLWLEVRVGLGLGIRARARAYWLGLGLGLRDARAYWHTHRRSSCLGHRRQSLVVVSRGRSTEIAQA